MGLLLLTGACVQPTAGSPVAAAPGDSIVETTPSGPPPGDEDPTRPSRPTTTRPTTTTARTSAAQVTITNRKTVATPPACAAMVGTAQIGQLTGTTATAEPEAKGSCSYTLARSGQPAGITIVALTAQLDAENAQQATFEGNTARRLSAQSTSCDLRVALTDDPSASYRVLWVSIVLASPGEPVCETVDKLARAVFTKLPGS